MKKRKGLTLAELLIVMAITVVLASAAIPAFGGQLETARNNERETRISAAVYDAYLDALKQNANTTVTLPQTILDDMRAYTKSADLSISFGNKFTITAANIPAAATSVACEFTKDSANALQLTYIIFYSGNAALTPAISPAP